MKEKVKLKLAAAPESVQGSDLKLPNGLTPEEVTRKGLQREKDTNEDIQTVAVKLGVASHAYSTMRDIILIHDRDDLSPSQRITVDAALKYMNAEKRVKYPRELIAPIVATIWGTPRKQLEKSRLINFDRAFGIVSQACYGATQIDIPLLSDERTEDYLKEIRKAVTDLRKFSNNLKEKRL